MSPEFRLSSPSVVTLTVGPWTLRLTRWDDVLVAQWIVGTWTQRVEVGEA
jgi:hypothetical protein